MKLKHLMAISFGLSGVCFAIFAMQNFVPGKYSWGAILFLTAVCYFNLAFYWANRED